MQKRFRKDRYLTLFIIVIIALVYIGKNMQEWYLESNLFNGIVLLSLTVFVLIGFLLPLLNRKAFKEFDGVLLVVFLLLITIGVLALVQMIFRIYPERFYGYGYDAISLVIISFALWQNHKTFVRDNVERRRQDTGKAVFWTGLGVATVKGFLFAYRDKKKKK